MKIGLTIAGSDSGAGAGIQADLKTFAANGVYAACVITAITAQNSRGVFGILDIQPEMVDRQLKAVFEDFDIQSVKIGMLSNSKIIEVVSENLKKYKPDYIVLDPVMIAQSGHLLIKDSAIDSIIEKLFPIATIITPNIPEFEKLFHTKVKSFAEVEDVIKKNFCQKKISSGLKKFYSTKNNICLPSILVKGGHFKECGSDLLYHKNNFFYLKSKYINTKNVHGTGCTLSSAIAANLIKYNDLIKAVKESKKYILNAIKFSYKIGSGAGPANHFYRLKSLCKSDV